MRDALANWVADADTLKYLDQFHLPKPDDPHLLQRSSRADDLYLSLVGELFDQLEGAEDDGYDWSALGNAFADFAFLDEADNRTPPEDTALFAAAAFFLGGFSASAYLTLRTDSREPGNEGRDAAYDLLGRPEPIASPRVLALIRALRQGDTNAMGRELEFAREQAALALNEGPEIWIGWRLYEAVIRRFAQTNVRSVLPAETEGFWDPLVASLLDRKPPVWDFFPSQIDAIRGGLVDSGESFSLQMPTGAGKTALTEALMFAHLTRNPDAAAIHLVPYRALAAELRRSLVRNLTRMGIAAGAAYGGTVPTGDEIQDLDQIQALVATPETLSGLLSANSDFLRRVSLVVCDEGHLLDGQARGVSLELLLARMKARDVGAPRFVFVSAIVPNIEEINAWLGGTDETVVRSEYRPALAEFAMLASSGTGVNQKLALRFHPHQDQTVDIANFLSRDDFRYRSSETGQLRTYGFGTVKSQTVATARKALQLGSVAVFAANKRGNQGCIGLAHELLAQLSVPLSLPTPRSFTPTSGASALRAAVEYLTLEYGAHWIGTRALEAGAILHHGDIPQETREVLERLVSERVVGLAFCTNTLAEGVNLPLRSLVLYSVQRRMPNGRPENLLARDIKNLVGRAGRPGATTRGLVICANANQWDIVKPVAEQAPGEPVTGALLELMERVERALARPGNELSNEALEGTAALHTLIDGVDSTLIDLAAEELGEDELVRLAGELAGHTYAAREADAATVDLMREVFKLRATRLAGIRSQGRLEWLRETGARARLLESVEDGLLRARDRWDDISEPTDPALLDAVLSWAKTQTNLTQSAAEVCRDSELTDDGLRGFVASWLEGQPLSGIVAGAGLTMDDGLALHARVISYELQTVVEQGIALLNRLCLAGGGQVSAAVTDFPEHLRFGVPTPAGRLLSLRVRHRRAAVALGQHSELKRPGENGDVESARAIAHSLLQDREEWLPSLGQLVLENTLADLG